MVKELKTLEADLKKLSNQEESLSYKGKEMREDLLNVRSNALSS